MLLLYNGWGGVSPAEGRQKLSELQPLLVSKKQAALMLGLSVRSIENFVARKQLVPRRVGRRVLFSRESLEQFARHDHSTQVAALKG